MSSLYRQRYYFSRYGQFNFANKFPAYDDLVVALARDKCPAGQIKRIAENMSKINPDLYPALNGWVTSGDKERLGDDDCNTDMLMDEFGLSYPGALITYDWYLRDPDACLNTLRHGGQDVLPDDDDDDDDEEVDNEEEDDTGNEEEDEE